MSAAPDLEAQLCKDIPCQVELATLPAFLRVLLTTDGTVTKSLEAYFWEPVIVDPLYQQSIVLQDDLPALERSKGDSLLLRQVQLRGQHSQHIFVRAESYICSDYVSPTFTRELSEHPLGIGEWLRACHLETCRKILNIGKNSRRDEVWRSYTIMMAHRPFIQITEHFALPLFRGEANF